jgi:hypothetical protein
MIPPHADISAHADMSAALIIIETSSSTYPHGMLAPQGKVRYEEGRCLTGVDSRAKGWSEFVAIDEEANHEIVHAFRLGEAQRAADEPLDPGPQIAMFALDFLRVLLAHLMLFGHEMPLIGPPAVGVKLRDAKQCQQLLEFQKDVVLPSSEHIRQDLARVMINGVPQPQWRRFLRDIRPHLVKLCSQSTPSIQFLSTADLHLHLRGMQDL